MVNVVDPSRFNLNIDPNAAAALGQTISAVSLGIPDLRMQGLQTEQATREAQLQQAQQQQQQQEAISLVTSERTSAIRRVGNINKVLGGSDEQLRNNIVKIAGELRDDPEFDAQEIAELSNLAVTDPAAARAMLEKELVNAGNEISMADQILGQNNARSSGQKERDQLLADLSSKDPRVASSASIALGLSPRAVGSAAQTITTQGTADVVADTESTLSEGKESGKLQAGLKLKPQIERAVIEARQEATAKGESFTELKRAKAAMPGLLTAVSQLKDLAKIATSTLGGRVFDTAVKETGFGSTKGATAKAKFIAIVNNQVLPLLKPTFGGSFSVQEGESLKATMGDPNASPEEKLAQLDAFINQKFRDIEAKESELNAVTPTTRLVFDPATGQLVPK